MSRPFTVTATLGALLVLGAGTALPAQTLFTSIEDLPILQVKSNPAKMEALRSIDDRGDTCVVMTTSCNTSVNSTLTDQDCPLDDGTFADFWEFQGTAGQTVTIDLTSAEFDTFLFLLDTAAEVVATDDDSGSGTNSRIVFTLNQTGIWTIAVNGFAPGDQGPYGLAISCSGTGGPGCTQTTRTLCLNDNRFQVEVDWTDFDMNSGDGRRVPISPASPDSGLLWFFNPDNWEMLIKVINGCPINNHYWVFYAATTNVEFTVRVIDTETGNSMTYFNPLGVSAPAVTDTAAFATCP